MSISVEVREAPYAYIITDGQGYWCGRRRDRSDRQIKIELWSTKKADAARIHFFEVASKVAADLPMPTRIVRVRA